VFGGSRRQQQGGVRWLKAFPASVLGPEWVKAMLGPFPDINFIATGGMRAGNADGYLDAGVRVVGLSSDFAPGGDSDAVRELISRRTWTLPRTPVRRPTKPARPTGPPPHKHPDSARPIVTFSPANRGPAGVN
jgi:hypothetical protein